MAIEMSTDKVICHKCGTAYSRRKGYFPVSYAVQHKGLGHAPICKTCIDEMYDGYLAQCHDTKLAVRQMCRKLDLYWDDKIYNIVLKKSTTRSMMTQYMSKLVSSSYAGKSYDDTLSAEGNLWSFAKDTKSITRSGTDELDILDDNPISDEVIDFWGPGYTPSMYNELEQRLNYWKSEFPEDVELDIGTKALIRQICSLEIDINRDRAAGRAVDKSVSALNTLLGSANLKPTQRKQEDEASVANNPLGMWLYIWENKRPLPDEYPESQILKYVFTWMGHLCKMLGVKGNKYTKLYEEEVSKYSVEKPEYDGDDEEAFLDFLEETPSYED